MRIDPYKCSKLISKILHFFEQGAIGSIEPITVCDFIDMESTKDKCKEGNILAN